MTREFHGDETEENWKRRQDYCSQLSELLENRGSEVPADFFDFVKDTIYGILQAATSERTTLSGQACRLVSNIVKVIGHQVHHLLDVMMPSLITHCSSTKSVNQKNADVAITTVVKYATYSPRLLYHICAAFQEKRNPPRVYAPGWLRLMLHQYHSHLTSEKDMDTINKAIVLGLNDAQVKVRENTRATYWEYAKLDPAGAEAIIDGLNTFAANALRDDSHNPDKKSNKTVKPSKSMSNIAALKAQAKQRMLKAEKETMATSKREDSHPAATTTHEPNAEIDLRVPINKEDRPTLQGAPSRSFLNAPVRRPRIVATPIDRPPSHDEQARQSKTSTERPPSRNDITRPSRSQAVDRPASRNDTSRTVRHAPEPHSARVEAARPVKQHRERERHVERHQERTQSVQTVDKHNDRPQSQHVAEKHVERAADKPVARPYVPEGKENVATDMPVEKAIPRPPLSEVKKATLVDRSINAPSPRPDPTPDVARRTLSVGIERLRSGTLDVMGFRKMKTLLDTNKRNLILDQRQYDDFFDLLLSALFNPYTPAENQRSRISAADQTTYTTLTIATMLKGMNEHYADWAEPRQSGTLSALLHARSSQAEKNQQITQAMLDLAAFIAGKVKDPSVVIGNVLDNLETAQSVKKKTSSGETEVSSPSTTNVSMTVTFGIRVLLFLLARMDTLGRTNSLSRDEEDRLGKFAQHCLDTHNSGIKRDVMAFCKVLYLFITPEDRFYSYFNSEADKNLINYYVAGGEASNGVDPATNNATRAFTERELEVAPISQITG